MKKKLFDRTLLAVMRVVLCWGFIWPALCLYQFKINWWSNWTIVLQLLLGWFAVSRNIVERPSTGFFSTCFIKWLNVRSYIYNVQLRSAERFHADLDRPDIMQNEGYRYISFKSLLHLSPCVTLEHSLVCNLFILKDITDIVCYSVHK